MLKISYQVVLMAKVIAISGAQGAGKSTLLEELKNRGYYVDGFKVSRSVQEQLGFTTLSDATSTLTTSLGFQEKVFEAKFRHDRELQKLGHEFVFVERSFADIYAYSLQWIKKHIGSHLNQSNVMSWILRFGTQCTEAQKLCYNGCILLPYMEHIVWQEDARRADKQSVDEVYSEITKFTSNSLASPGSKLKTLEITKQLISDRADEVETFLKEI